VLVHLHANPPSAGLRQTCSGVSRAEAMPRAVTSANTRRSILKSKLLRDTRLTNLPLHFTVKIVIPQLFEFGAGIYSTSCR